MIKEKNDQEEKKSTEKQFVKCEYILLVAFSGGGNTCGSTHRCLGFCEFCSIN